MATANHLKALLRSHADGDDERFYAVALQMAAQEARLGHTKFALELRELVDSAQKRTGGMVAPRQRPIPIVQPQGELAGLLNIIYPDSRLSEMVLDDELRKQIEHVVIEQRQREQLKEGGFEPQRKLLLVGPPGTGKTMTARVLAGELGLPLFTIQIDGLITKFLGETAAKLRLIFEAIARSRALYFFDEFDALGGERGARNDVAEIRRVLNSFLQFLEQDQSESLIVAATNHPDLLDRALFRRFDAVIEYVLPTPEVAALVMRSRLSMFDTSEIDWAKVTAATTGLSHADAVRCSDHAAKKAILERTTRINNVDLMKAVQVRHSMHGRNKRK